ncbi:hypothetical protein J2Z17_003928 [Rhizobium halophytocola]|uniref:Uncharacterized protein n=1 Tax=Rhizobium halophytocola TaxID=735519 RepID=A0ABS4E3H8_9HYPH|nr:hypothetical protein [Rhizobium halophytocola]
MPARALPAQEDAGQGRRLGSMGGWAVSTGGGPKGFNPGIAGRPDAALLLIVSMCIRGHARIPLLVPPIAGASHSYVRIRVSVVLSVVLSVKTVGFSCSHGPYSAENAGQCCICRLGVDTDAAGRNRVFGPLGSVPIAVSFTFHFPAFPCGICRPTISCREYRKFKRRMSPGAFLYPLGAKRGLALSICQVPRGGADRFGLRMPRAMMADARAVEIVSCCRVK